MSQTDTDDDNTSDSDDWDPIKCLRGEQTVKRARGTFVRLLCTACSHQWILCCLERAPSPPRKHVAVNVVEPVSTPAAQPLLEYIESLGAHWAHHPLVQDIRTDAARIQKSLAERERHKQVPRFRFG
jgi:hypothetical protein